jgi:tRNA uridine 5-carboxymethylaminomethyl modification enzyme
LTKLFTDCPVLSPEVEEQVVTDLKYRGYLEREGHRVERRQRLESVRLPEGFSFRRPGISTEVAERLERARPATLGAAGRLPGVTPAALDLLAVALARQERHA